MRHRPRGTCAMSEDRTQPPSKRRRQMARQHGQAAHSPELTAAVGWLAAVVLLGFCGRRSGGCADRAGARSAVAPGPIGRRCRRPSRRMFAGSIAGVGLAAGGDSGRFCRSGLCGPSTASARVVGDVADRPGPEAGSGDSRRARDSPRFSFNQPGRWRKGLSWWRPRHGCFARAGHDFLRQSSLEGPKLAQAAGQIVLRVSWTLAGVLACCWDWSTMCCGTGGSRRCCERRRRSSGRISG